METEDGKQERAVASTRRLTKRAFVLAVVVLLLALVTAAVSSVGDSNDSTPRLVLGIAMAVILLLAIAGLAVTVVVIVIRSRFDAWFGWVTLIVAILWLPVTIVTQLVINAVLSIDGPVGTFGASVLWAFWIVWLAGSTALVITWVVTSLRSSSRAQREISEDQARQVPPGWYPDPSGSGRMRWFDGVVWRDEYGDAPSSGQ